MTLDEAIEQLENPNVHALTFSCSELTKWLKELKKLREEKAWKEQQLANRIIRRK